MIRQLPKLSSLPSFIMSDGSQIMDTEAKVKIYDLITESTQLNSVGNTLQLQLF